ncbi:MAG TPA: DUF465 domain-containing protein [Syntrophaceae bacterium]|nr:DUF465 domain-containing protein [Syntrophaceae bacterium]
MEKRDEELIHRLMENDPILRKYWEEHLLFEEQLEAFNKRIYLTPEEELEKKRIQKLKLAGRDKIEEILSRYR